MGFFVFNFSCSVVLYSVFVVGIVLGWVVGLVFGSFLYLISVVGLCLFGVCVGIVVGVVLGLVVGLVLVVFYI